MYRIRFLMQSPIETPDQAGGYIKSWVEQGFAWGMIETQTGKAGDLDAHGRSFFEVRLVLWDVDGSGLGLGWRLLDADHAYEVIAIKRLAGNRAHITTRREIEDEL